MRLLLARHAEEGWTGGCRSGWAVSDLPLPEPSRAAVGLTWTVPYRTCGCNSKWLQWHSRNQPRANHLNNLTHVKIMCCVRSKAWDSSLYFPHVWYFYNSWTKKEKKKQKEKKKKKQLLSSLFLPHEFGILGGTVMSGPFQCAKLGATPLALQKFVIKKWRLVWME